MSTVFFLLVTNPCTFDFLADRYVGHSRYKGKKKKRKILTKYCSLQVFNTKQYFSQRPYLGISDAIEIPKEGLWP